MLAVAAAYYGAAKLGQTLRYTASVSAIWPPAGVGIAALYLWGVRWWPGVLLAELIVNAELLLDSMPLPAGSLAGQQTGNMLEVVVGALVLRRLIGPDAAMDRVDDVVGVMATCALATAISAIVGTVSMLAGGVIEPAQAATFLRTWWLGDFAGAIVVVSLALAWARRAPTAWARIRTWEGVLLLAAVTGLGVIAVSTAEPVTYVVFPALIWAAFRFGPPGATLAIAIATGLAIGITANEVGPFFKQPIDHRTLSTQIYVAVTALTTLFLGAVVSEHEQSTVALAEARRHEGERAVEERRRIARELHDSVSQGLFSTLMHVRTSQKALGRRDGTASQSLGAAAELIKGAQSDIRALVHELGRDPVENGLVEAVTQHAARLPTKNDLIVDVQAPDGAIDLNPRMEGELFGIAREALANVVKHAGAANASVRVEAREGRVVLEIRDDGCGFDLAERHPGHFGLDSMRSRATEIGGALTITSAPARGTVVRVEAPAQAGSGSDDL